MPDWTTLDAYEHGEPIESFEIEGARIVMLCLVCPESYDVFLGDKQIGYMRLRYGRFYAAFPDVGGEIVYDRHLEPWQGCFAPEERVLHLPLAVRALIERAAACTN